MKFKMEWSGVSEQNGHIEIRSGYRSVIADDEEEAKNIALHFLYNFINWDAILEDANGRLIASLDSE